MGERGREEVTVGGVSNNEKEGDGCEEGEIGANTAVCGVGKGSCSDKSEGGADGEGYGEKGV